jgi:hypothetical protein
MRTEGKAALLCLFSCIAWHGAACSSNSPTTPGGATGSQTTGSQTTGSQSAGSQTGSTTSTGSAAVSGASAGTGSGASAGTGSGASGGTAVGTGSSTGTGAAGASGSTTGAAACSAPTVATGLISDFATGKNVSNQLVGGTDTWYSVPAPTVTTGVAHFLVPATATNMYPAVSTVIAAMAAGVVGCVDLTAKYTSISFKISSPTNTSLLFEIASLETARAQDGSGFRKSFTLSTTMSTVTIKFADLIPPPFGVGLTQSMTAGFNVAKDAAAIVLGVGTAGTTLDIQLTDVTFL